MSFHNLKSLVKCIDNFLRKRPFHRVLTVLLQLHCAACTEDDAIAHVKSRMMLAPSQRNLGKVQVMFFLEK